MSSSSKMRRRSETEILNSAVLKNRSAIYAKMDWVRLWCVPGKNTLNAFTFVEEEAAAFVPGGDVL